jgi:lipopolysaccharide/colanic/teichoic acid biosynthesis glycosyltransferase
VATIPIVRQAASERTAASRTSEWWERGAAAFLLILVSPLLLLGGAVIAMLSRRSPLIAHRRVGWRGETLWMLKLRTMWGDDGARARGWIQYIDDPIGPGYKNERDPRVPNAFARFCRRHSIDELPQLLHVIRGEMSLVGPRPLTAIELRRYYGEDASEVLEAKPGIAGLWQVSGRNRLTYAERRALDLELVRTRSSGMYVRILVRAAAEVWSGPNSW